MRIFWADKVKKRISILQEVKLDPGQMTALPDHENPEIHSMMKICVKPSFSSKWSDEFKLQGLKDKLEVGKNIVWGHHRTYSILRKEKMEKEGVFNLVIRPPIIVMNCLPCRISVNVSEVNKDKAKKIEMGDDEAIENYELAKGEERQLSQI